MKYTLKFTDPLGPKVDRSGGKGANLSILTQAGFLVPPGFIVTSQAYRDFIEGGRELLSNVADLPFHDNAALRSESERLRAELGKLALPSQLAEEVRAELSEFPGESAFSVRSSSTMEDLSSA